MKQVRHQGISETELLKLRQDLQAIMDEIDGTPKEVLDAYSPHMWSRLQKTTEKIATAINAVRLRLSGKTCAEIAAELGVTKSQVAGYVAWNTMLQPSWMSRTERRILARTGEER
jgi:hypothetical protein